LHDDRSSRPMPHKTAEPRPDHRRQDRQCYRLGAAVTN